MKRRVVVLSALVAAVAGFTQFGYGSSVASATERKAPRESRAPQESLGSLKDLDSEMYEHFLVEISVVEERIKSAEEASVLLAESSESALAQTELLSVLDWSIVDLGDGKMLVIQDTGEGVRVFLTGRGDGAAEGRAVFGNEGRTEITRLETVGDPGTMAAKVSCAGNDNFTCCAWSNPPKLVCPCRQSDGTWKVCIDQQQ